MGLMDDSKKGFWVYLKLCNEDCDTELAEAVSIWFRCGVDGYLLPDTDDVRNLCTLYNLKLINAMLPTAEPKKKDDSAHLERLQRDLETLREELRPTVRGSQLIPGTFRGRPGRHPCLPGRLQKINGEGEGAHVCRHVGKHQGGATEE